MKQLIGVLLCSAMATAAQAADWKLVWSDEFNGRGLPDPSKWTYETGYVRNDERQFYTRARPENARLEGGRLIIEARKERYRVPGPEAKAQSEGRGRRGRDRQDAEYTSASLTTQGKAAWTY